MAEALAGSSVHLQAIAVDVVVPCMIRTDDINYITIRRCPLFKKPLLSSLRTTHVPVGEDQIQHLELAQGLARIFNGRYGDLFPEPSALLSKNTHMHTLGVIR